MKHKVTAAVCIVAIIVVGFLSVQAYNRYRHWRTVHTAQVTQQQADAAKSTADQQAAEKAHEAALEKLCAQDLTDYLSLSPAKQAQEQKPDCSSQFVQ